MLTEFREVDRDMTLEKYRAVIGRLAASGS
jgi:hypothetical protein